MNGCGYIHDGVQVAGTNIYGIGALAIGQLKYATQHQLLKQMLPQDQEKTQDKPQDKPGQKIKYLDFMAAFNLARELSKNQS